MKLPNSYGSVYKLKGNRRKPWAVAITVARVIEDGKARTKRRMLGYYAKREDALNALALYHQDPYDLQAQGLTFAEVHKMWAEEHYKEVVEGSTAYMERAFENCNSLHDMPMKAIRTAHLEAALDNADISLNNKSRMRTLFTQMYRYAMKHEIVQKDYAVLCKKVKTGPAKIVRKPFSESEILTLLKEDGIGYNKMILTGILTGFRPQELATIAVSNVDMENRTITAGMKTEAGRNRIVPIHDRLVPFIEKQIQAAESIGSENLFFSVNDNRDKGDILMNYDRYFFRFNKTMEHYGWHHHCGDTRHTFISMAKEAKIDEYVIKLIAGHAIKDVTEAVYTHRTPEYLRKEINTIPVPSCE